MALDRLPDAIVQFARTVGGTRPGVLFIGRVVSPLQRRLLRATGGRLSLTGRAPVLLLTTRGRRTGKPRTVPLLFVRDGDLLVVCNVNPGFERPNPWTLNVRADPRVRVEIGRDAFQATAHEASEAEVQRYWPQLTRVWPAYGTFFDQGGRRSVFVLEPGPLDSLESHSQAKRRRKKSPLRATGSAADATDRTGTTRLE